MRLLLPARKFSAYLAFVVFCLIGGVIVWNKRQMESLEDYAFFVFILAVFFWLSLIMLIREFRSGPLFYLYKEKRTFKIPLQADQATRIGPFYNAGGYFLIVDMVFKASLEKLAGLRSFRLAKGFGNPKISGWVEVCASAPQEDEEIVRKTVISWFLYEESGRCAFIPTYELEVQVPCEGPGAHYLIISPLIMTGASQGIMERVAQQDVPVEVTLRIGGGIGWRNAGAWPSLKEIEVVAGEK